MQIRQHDYGTAMNRFYGFADAVLRSINLSYADDGSKHAAIVVACRDSEATANEGWVSVSLHVRGVREFKVFEGARTTLQVMSHGIHIHMYDDIVGIEFGGEVDPPPTIADLRKSDAFVIGTEVQIEVGPY